MNFEDFKRKFQKVEVEEFVNQMRHKTPLVTVCVQTFQHHKYIKMCLDSILKQETNFNFEIYQMFINNIFVIRNIIKNF